MPNSAESAHSSETTYFPHEKSSTAWKSASLCPTPEPAHHALNELIDLWRAQLAAESRHAVIRPVRYGICQSLVGFALLPCRVGKVRRARRGTSFPIWAVAHGAALLEDNGCLAALRNANRHYGNLGLCDVFRKSWPEDNCDVRGGSSRTAEPEGVDGTFMGSSEYFTVGHS